MKKSISICLTALLALAVSCKKDNSNDSPKQQFGIDGVTPMPEAVDLGLSVKWASFNIGATKEYEYGDYYAWGETSTKDNYDWASYKWCTGAGNKLTKYCPKDRANKWDASAKPEGPDGNVKLLPDDDVAHVKLGGHWRMPTHDDLNELLALKKNDNYTWEKWATVTDSNGKDVYGIRITRTSTGATLFLPAAGYCEGTSIGEDAGSLGRYWTASLLDNTIIPDSAICLSFRSEDSSWNGTIRCNGRSVRPVWKE